MEKKISTKASNPLVHALIIVTLVTRGQSQKVFSNPRFLLLSLFVAPCPSPSDSRHEFDSEQIPDLTKDVYIQDIHCVGSLCKLYFRELPNPLLTYQLYEKFSVSIFQATPHPPL